MHYCARLLFCLQRTIGIHVGFACWWCPTRGQRGRQYPERNIKQQIGSSRPSCVIFGRQRGLKIAQMRFSRCRKQEYRVTQCNEEHIISLQIHHRQSSYIATIMTGKAKAQHRNQRLYWFLHQQAFMQLKAKRAPSRLHLVPQNETELSPLPSAVGYVWWPCSDQ